MTTVLERTKFESRALLGTARSKNVMWSSLASQDERDASPSTANARSVFQSLRLAPEATPATPQPTSDRYARLEILAALRDGWNNDEGLAPSIRALQSARQFIALLESSPQQTPFPFLYPTDLGGILLDWHVPVLEVEFLPNGGATVWTEQDDEPAQFARSADASDFALRLLGVRSR